MYILLYKAIIFEYVGWFIFIMHRILHSSESYGLEIFSATASESILIMCHGRVMILNMAFDALKPSAKKHG